MPSLVWLAQRGKCEPLLDPANPVRAASWLARHWLSILVIMPVTCGSQGHRDGWYRSAKGWRNPEG